MSKGGRSRKSKRKNERRSKKSNVEKGLIQICENLETLDFNAKKNKIKSSLNIVEEEPLQAPFIRPQRDRAKNKARKSKRDRDIVKKKISISKHAEAELCNLFKRSNLEGKVKKTPKIAPISLESSESDSELELEKKKSELYKILELVTPIQDLGVWEQDTTRSKKSKKKAKKAKKEHRKIRHKINKSGLPDTKVKIRASKLR